MRGSQRDYAKHRGISHVAVGKAVKAGRIKLDPDGKIDFAKADAQWSRNTDPVQQLRTVGGRASSEGNNRQQTKPASAPVDLPAPIQQPHSAPMPHGGLDYNKARAIRETFAARLLEIEFKEKSGQYVKKDDMRIGIFKALTILKTNVLGIHSKARLQSDIPPQIIDLIDNLCRTALEETHRSLQELSDG